MSKRIAIIGATGQLGSDLVKLFGDDAIPLAHSDIEVTQIESCRILERIRPQVVINCAAYVRVDDCERYPERAFMVNSIGARNIAIVCRKIDAVDIYISTDYVFDGNATKPYMEHCHPNPINTYGISKYAGEIYTRNLCPKHYIIRLASLFGVAGARGKGGNFVEAIISKARSGEKLRVVDDQIMSPTYTMDVAQMLAKFLDLDPEFGIYHMVNSGYCSWYQFAKEIFKLLKWDIEIHPISSREWDALAARPRFSALENSRLNSMGLKMRNWREALKDYLIQKGYLIES